MKKVTTVQVLQVHEGISQRDSTAVTFTTWCCILETIARAQDRYSLPSSSIADSSLMVPHPLQVRSWLLSHPHLCPVDSFQECDIDHIIPRSLGGHDHPYNYYIMPKRCCQIESLERSLRLMRCSMNQRFNKWMTRGNACFTYSAS